MRNVLHEFFAVTTTSVYRVSDQKDGDGVPLVEKIAKKGDGRVAVGGRLRDGGLVAVTRLGLFLYSDDLPSRGRAGNRPARLEEVNMLFWGGHTSRLVGLFLRKEDALICFELGDAADASPLCHRRHTLAVLLAIGTDHPTFTLSKDPRFAFIFD